MDLSEYQSESEKTNLHRGGDPIAFYLLGLAGEVGTLAAEYKKRLRDGGAHQSFTARMAEELGDVLWYAAALASELGLDLEIVAAQNLSKTSSRWTGRDASDAQLDSDAPIGEQFPRRFSARFEPDGEHVVVLDDQGNALGDRLTDNANVADHYRYHDVFHLAHASVLGWSPVTRSMLHRKRKYDAQVDEVEDGARAIFTEEAVTALVFKYAEENNFFDGAQHVDSELLKAVQRLVAGLEVSVRSMWEWESAILQGYGVWRQMVSAKRGVVRCDLDLGMVAFEATPD